MARRQQVGQRDVGGGSAARGTLIVAIARLRYSAARGRQRDGHHPRQLPGRVREARRQRRDRLPADERRASASRPRARSDSQPCGTNGVQLAGPRRARRAGDGHDHHTDQQADEDELGSRCSPGAHQPRGASRVSNSIAATIARASVAAAGQPGDVAGSDEADDRARRRPPRPGSIQLVATRRPAGPGRMATYPMTPPAEGTCLPNAEKTAANRPDRTEQGEPGQDRDAGLASAAARPGRSRRPGPRSAPM